MKAYFVLILWQDSADVLYASLNKEDAENECKVIQDRWVAEGEPKEVWVAEHEINDVIFNYDWFNPINPSNDY